MRAPVGRQISDKATQLTANASPESGINAVAECVMRQPALRELLAKLAYDKIALSVRSTHPVGVCAESLVGCHHTRIIGRGDGADKRKTQFLTWPRGVPSREGSRLGTPGRSQRTG
jgi:hypothetical protein